MRKLATIQRIIDLQPIEGADLIEVAKVQGWKVVVKKGEFNIGDLIVYLEIDSWVPTELAPFLSKGEPKEYNSIKGERLRSIRLRGTLSQGLILPTSSLPSGTNFNEGDDVSEILGVTKWEPVLSATLGGVAKGLFPSFLTKTDEERIQNLVSSMPTFDRLIFNLHEKLDGTSFTVFKTIDGEFGVCSRNLQLKESEGNVYWRIAKKYDLENILPKGLYIQGEIVGPGVQGNKYNLKELELYCFSVTNIEGNSRFPCQDAKRICEELGLKWVPYVSDFTITSETTVDQLLEIAEGKSLLNNSVEREGLVWRLRKNESNDFVSFKTISNKFLLKYE